MILQQQSAAVSQPHGVISEFRQPLQSLGFQIVDSEPEYRHAVGFQKRSNEFPPIGRPGPYLKPRAELGRHDHRLRRLVLPRSRDFHH